MVMEDTAGGKGTAPGSSLSGRVDQYKKDFWGKANLKFGEPWYRLRKAARIIDGLAGGRACTLLDIGCGPATLMRLLPPYIQYFGIDIAIQEPAPNLIEADLVESEIAFDGRRFDLVTALGVFEYVGDVQSRKFSEIARLLNGGGKFLVTYTNFGHRKKRIYEAFSNVQPLESFRRDLRRYFTIDRSFPASHNWKHSQPDRNFVKAANMHVNMNIPILSPVLAVDYFFICSPLGAGKPPARGTADYQNVLCRGSGDLRRQPLRGRRP
jgi:SAM-dependent methyltransferase